MRVKYQIFFSRKMTIERCLLRNVAEQFSNIIMVVFEAHTENGNIPLGWFGKAAQNIKPDKLRQVPLGRFASSPLFSFDFG